MKRTFHQDPLPGLARRQLSFEQLQPRVIYSAVVGSVAWGLADEDCDEDLKGVFLLPFEHHAGLWEPPDEIQDPASDTQYWEVQKLVYQGLRADANTLELLWSPHPRVCTELGHELIAGRRMFVSRNIFGTFGRYAMSPFRKLRAARRRRLVQRVVLDLLARGKEPTEVELVQRLCDAGAVHGPDARRLAREAVRDLHRSLFDRGLIERRGLGGLVRHLDQHPGADPGQLLPPAAPRWNNAYNLLRLLHSGIRWLTEGQPLMELQGELRAELLAVKRGQLPLEQVLRRADQLARQLEQAFEQTSLPAEPDYQAAHAFLLRCRRHAAAESEDGARSAE